MRLGIDLDGVIADFTQGWVDFYNRDFGAELHPDRVSTWGGLTEFTHFENMEAFWHWSSDLDGRSLFWHLEAYPGAVETLHELNDQGHQIVILTMKPRFAVDDTHDWVADRGIPAAEVHILEDKWSIDCHIYLDDGPHVLPRLVANRPDRVVCRYIRPWNTPVPGVIDVADLGEFRDLVVTMESAD